MANPNSQLSSGAGGWTWHFCHLTTTNKNVQSHKKQFSTNIYISLRQVVYVPTYIEQKRHNLFARQSSSKAISDVVLEIRPYFLQFWNKRYDYNNFSVHLLHKIPILKEEINI